MRFVPHAHKVLGLKRLRSLSPLPRSPPLFLTIAGLCPPRSFRTPSFDILQTIMACDRNDAYFGLDGQGSTRAIKVFCAKDDLKENLPQLHKKSTIMFYFRVPRREDGVKLILGKDDDGNDVTEILQGTDILITSIKAQPEWIKSNVSTTWMTSTMVRYAALKVANLGMYNWITSAMPLDGEERQELLVQDDGGGETKGQDGGESDRIENGSGEDGNDDTVGVAGGDGGGESKFPNDDDGAQSKWLETLDGARNKRRKLAFEYDESEEHQARLTAAIAEVATVEMELENLGLLQIIDAKAQREAQLFAEHEAGVDAPIAREPVVVAPAGTGDDGDGDSRSLQHMKRLCAGNEERGFVSVFFPTTRKGRAELTKADMNKMVQDGEAVKVTAWDLEVGAYDDETRRAVRDATNLGDACEIMASRLCALGLRITEVPDRTCALPIPVTHAVRVGLTWGVGSGIVEFGSGWFFKHPSGDHLVGTAGTLHAD